MSRAVRAQVAAAAASGTPDLTAGVKYLTDTANLVDGTHYEQFGFTDLGLTMDAAFALAATGTAGSTLAKITHYVATNADDWTGIGTASPSGGSIGKESLLAEVTGYDPRDFGGHDLIAALDDTVCTRAAPPACAGAGDYENATSVFSQSLGVMAQLRAGDTAGAAQPIAFLESLQDSSGWFPSGIGVDGPDVDSTAMAAMALSLVPTDATAKAAVDKALASILGKQLPDGGFQGAAGDSTNSAALALQGMALAGDTDSSQIAKALAFLAGQQNSDGGFNVSADGQLGSDVRATAQVVGGVVGTSFGTLFDDVTGVPLSDPPPSSGPRTSSASASAAAAASSSALTSAASSSPAVAVVAADPRVIDTATPAQTGTPSGPLIGLAAVLLGAGLILWFAGRRPRIALGGGRHRGRSR